MPKRRARPNRADRVPKREKISEDVISSFIGKYSFLANTFLCEVQMDGEIFPSVEHALQSAKLTDPKARELVKATPNAIEAKRVANKHRALHRKKLRKNKVDAEGAEKWRQRSLLLAEKLVRDKFRRHKSLRDRLLSTRGREFVFCNTFGDHFWGVCGGKGHNHLGTLLEKLRTELVVARDCGIGKWIEDQFPLSKAAEIRSTLTLVVRRGDERAAADIVLRHGKYFTFGKSSACDVQLKNPSVSRIHAAIVHHQDGRTLLVDFASTHKTRVNRKTVLPLHPLAIDTGDVIRFANSSRTYRVSLDREGEKSTKQRLYAAAMELSKDDAISGDSMDNSTVYVGNLPYEATDEQVKAVFEEEGLVPTSVRIIKDRSTGRARGFAFVTFTSYPKALKAQRLDGATLDGFEREISVRMATKR